MAITTLNLRALNRSDTATSGQVITTTSATAADFQDAAGGYWNLIKSITASSSATVSFVNGTSDVVIDSTYKQYMIRMTNVHPATDGADLTFNGSIDTGSNYNVAKMSSVYATYHREGDAAEAGHQYRGTEDSTLATAFAELMMHQSNDNDSSGSGTLIFYEPSNTTFVKYFSGDTLFFDNSSAPYAKFASMGGYFNTASAIDAFQFKYSSGNIDAGEFKLYGAT
tara:strand:+ start:7 stop:681 length:675 start_codon:yes stop_codon:yes gene_type:complete